MDFNIGMVVSFNEENYIILEKQEQVLEGKNILILRIKNILTQEVFNVPSTQVSKINVEKYKYNNRPNNQVEVKDQVSEDDTLYIKSLFDQVGSEDTTDFFNISGEITYNLDDVIDETSDISTTKPTFENIVENFRVPQTRVIQPRRHNNITMVDETFSDMKIVGEIPTQDLTSAVKPMEVEDNTMEFFAKKTKELDDVMQADNDEMKVVNTQSIPNNTEMQQPIFFNNSNIIEKPVVSVTPMMQSPMPEFDFKSEQLRETATQKVEPIETTMDLKYKFNENIADDVSLTSPTQRVLLDGFQGKADKFRERHQDTLQLTGHLNTKRLLESIDRRNELKNNTEEFEEYNEIQSETSTIFGNEQVDPKVVLQKSRIYRRFKTWTIWLITLFVVTISIPLIAVYIKFTVAYLNGSLDWGFMGDMSMAANDGAANLVANAFIDVVTPIMGIILFSFGIAYLVQINKKQYQKLAYFNYQVQKQLAIIDQLQEFNNESSAFMIKLHKDNKELKNTVKKIEKIGGIKPTKNSNIIKKIH